MKIHCDAVLYSVTEFVGVTTREIELMTEEEKDCKRRRLNGFIWENDNKCSKMSHFFLHHILLGPVTSLTHSKESERENSKKERQAKTTFRYQKATHNVMGAFSDFIEMLYIFHSASNLCLLLHIALQDMCRHLKRRLAFLLVVSDFY